MTHRIQDVHHRWGDKSCGRTACMKPASESHCNLMTGWFYCPRCWNRIKHAHGPPVDWMVIQPKDRKLREGGCDEEIQSEP